MIEQVFIVGGGESIKKYNLFGSLKDKFSIACNSSFMDFEPTAVVFKDYSFGIKYKDELNKQFIITSSDAKPYEYLREPIVLKTEKRLDGGGFYTTVQGLTGVFALSIINNLFDNIEIYLFGFDFNKGNYHDRNERNSDAYENYDETQIRELFEPIKAESYLNNNKIYTVGFTRIPNFKNIDFNDIEFKEGLTQLENRMILNILLEKHEWNIKNDMN